MSNFPMFNRDFDVEIERETREKQAARAPRPDAEEVARMVAQAREEGRAEGMKSGREQALEETGTSLSAARVSVLEELKPRMTGLLDELADHGRKLEADMISFLLTLCEKAMPHLVDQMGMSRLQSEMEAIAIRAQGSRWLEVRVSEENCNDIDAALASLRDTPAGKRDLRVIADSSLGNDAIHASWQGGSSTWSYERLCRSIIDHLKSNHRQSETDIPENPDNEENAQ